MHNEIDRIADIFKRNQDRVFVVNAKNGREFRYGDIERLSCKLATWLEARGIRNGDRVAIILPNCIEFILFYFACMQTGAIAVPLNPKLTEMELDAILTRANPAIVITEEQRHVSRIRRQFTVGSHFLLDIEKETPIATPFAAITDDDIFVTSYTSGTTALPKGVSVRYRSIVRHAIVFGRAIGVRPELRWYSILPTAYMGGWYNLMLIPFFAEGSIVLDAAFNPAQALRFWETACRYRVNAFWFVPTILSVLLSLDRQDADVHPPRPAPQLALVGTAPLTQELKVRFEKRYDITLYENYGLSETFIATTNTPFGLIRGVGQALSGCSIWIRSEDGSRCAVGVEGEVVIQSPFTMAGYYGDPMATAAMIHADGVYTGDVGFLDPDGYLHITGRKKDIIIRGGINVSPFEVEEAITAHPAVAEAAVVGVPDPAAGEDIAAVVCVRAPVSAQELREHCGGRLAAFKVPKYWEFVENFPRSVTGKIQKNVLKEIAAKKFAS